MLPLLRDKAARHQACSVSVPSRARTGAACAAALTRQRSPKQLVPLLLSNDVDRSSMCCQPSTTAQLVGYCICGVMRTYTGAAGLVVPHNGPVRLACHRVRTHPSEKPCASSVGTRSHSEAPCADAPPVKRRQRTLLALAARWRKWLACGNSHASSSCLAHEPNPRPARDQHTSSTRTHSQGYQLDTEQYHSTPSSVRLLTALRTRANGTCCFPYQRAGGNGLHHLRLQHH